MSEPSKGDVEERESRDGTEDPLRSLLRGAFEEAGPAPNVLAGVQKKIRERSGGKFYADGWSTAKHPPGSTYLATSLFMLAILVVAYALLSPLSGTPEAVHNQPAPVQLIPQRAQ
jgi:hypothetical protein